MLEIYLDGADLKQIKTYKEDPNVTGFTTNPTLAKSAGVKNYTEFAKRVSSLVFPKPVSIEVLADDDSKMKSQAEFLQSISENIFVKIPIINTVGTSNAKTIGYLAEKNINLNITAIFTLKQVESITSLLLNNKMILSIFAGRIADTGINPCPIIMGIKELIPSTSRVKLLWASSREVYNIIEAKSCGCDIITLSADLISKSKYLDKDLEEFSKDTVKMFYDDALKANLKLEP
jgi:transaldolase